MKNLVLFFMLCVGFGEQLDAQHVSGRVVDHENRPLAGVHCVLMDPSDTTRIAGTTTRPDGYFELKANEINEVNNVKGNEDTTYLLQLSCIGFEKVFRACKPGNLGNILLRRNAESLAEIVVKGDSRRKDAMTETFFLTDSLRNSSKNSLQLLDQLPGISVEWASDAIKIGEYRDVPLMLNGREAGKNLIQNLNPQRIRKIELLRYPKGKYGEIPIVLNCITYDDYSGYEWSVQSKGLVSFRTPHSHSEHAGADFVCTSDRGNVYGELAVNGKKMYRAASYSYLYRNEVAEATEREDYRHPNSHKANGDFSVSLGTDYKIAAGHTVSLQSWLEGGRHDEREGYRLLGNAQLSENQTDYNYLNTTSGLYYRGNITDRLVITSDLTYNYYRVHERRLYHNPVRDTQLSYTGRKDFWRYNADVNPIWNNALRSNLGYTYTAKSYVNNDRLTGEALFRTQEKRHDIYASLMIRPHRKVSLVMGSNVLVVHRDNGLDSDDRCSWMPSAKLHWQASGKLSLTGNYFCDIEYPNLDQLSTVTYNRNRILMYRGNPDLQERVMHYMEWRIRVPKVMEVTYMLKHSANEMTPWYYTENDYVVETLTGCRYRHQYIGLSGDYRIGQKFSMNFTANYQWYGRKGTESIWRRGHTSYFDVAATCRMSPHVSLRAAYFLRDDHIPLLQGEKYDQEEILQLGLLGHLCQGRWSLSVHFTVPTSLLPKRTCQDITLPGFRFTSWEDERVNHALMQVGLRYNFGKGSVSKSKNPNRSETEK